MDHQGFDHLAREFASVRSRRHLLKQLAIASAGALLTSVGIGADNASAKGKQGKKCYGGGSKCSKGTQCCSGRCTNRVCEPPPTGGGCTTTICAGSCCPQDQICDQTIFGPGCCVPTGSTLPPGTCNSSGASMCCSEDGITAACRIADDTCCKDQGQSCQDDAECCESPCVGGFCLLLQE